MNFSDDEVQARYHAELAEMMGKRYDEIEAEALLAPRRDGLVAYRCRRMPNADRSSISASVYRLTEDEYREAISDIPELLI